MKVLALKIAVFAVIFTVIQAFISYSTMPQQIKNVKKYLANKIDVIYFGDSVMTFAPDYEIDKDSIVELMKKNKPVYRIESLDHEAYNMDIFYSFAKYMSNSGNRPEILVIPINMATFSNEYLRPNYQFDIERAVLENNNMFFNIFYRPIGIFGKQSVTRGAYMNAEVFDGDKAMGKVKDFDNSTYSSFSPENLNKKIIFRYMYKLNGNEAKIKSLTKLLDLYKGNGTKLIFYVTPVDYLTCVKSYGKMFKTRTDFNVEFLKKLIVKNGAVFIDLTYSLPSDMFAWKQHMYVNEHLNLKGRQFIAKTMNDEILKYLDRDND